MARSAAPRKTNVVPIAEAKQKRPRGMWRLLHAAARALVPRGSRGASQYRPNPFTPAKPLPGVVGAGSQAQVPKIALDAAETWKKMATDADPLAVAGTAGWVGAYAGAYAASAYMEGQEWLGYAILAILSQRPEYRIATDIYATDMTREWVEFKSKSDDESKKDRIDELVERLDELKLKSVVKAAIENDGFQGRGQIYVDTGDEDDPEELKTPIGTGGDDTLAKFGRKKDESASDKKLALDFDPRDDPERERPQTGKRVRRLAAIEPMWCYPSQYNADDPLKPDWYRPETWWVMGKEVHRTRLLTFVSNPVADMLKPAYSFGGIARTQQMKPYVDFWLRNRTSGSDLLNNFSVPVLKTELDVTTMDEGSELFQRVLTFNVLRDNQSTMVINKDSEEFEIAQTSLAGVKDLVGQSAEHLCLPGRIPIVKYFGDQPSGLNASSEGVIRLWYDSVKALQESLLREPIQTIVWLVMIGLWGEVDDDIVFTFKDLWQLDAAGKSAVQKTKADTRAVDIESGLILPDEGRQAVAKDPDSQYQGLDLDEPLPEPDPDLFGETGGEGGEGGGQGGPQPSRRDLGGMTSTAARAGGAATGGFSADRRRGSRVLPFDEWRESEHPRGQPENKGQFGPGGGGGSEKARKIAAPVRHEGRSAAARIEFGKEWSDVSVEDPATALFDEHADPDVVSDPKVAAARLIESYPPAVRELIADTDARVHELKAQGKETEKLHKDADGNWTPERQRVHLEVLGQIFTPEAVEAARPVEGQKPKFVMLGGRGGSGKSWFTEEQGIGADCLKLDGDEIKSKLPEYEGWNAALLHEEASYLFDRATDIAKSQGLNICHDATMKTTDKAVALVEHFASEGYVPEAHYMFCSPQEAARRAIKRFVSGMEKNGRGRYVPPSYTMGSTTNERTFDEVKDLCKSWSLYDNDVWGREPRHVANGGRSKSFPEPASARASA